MTVSSSGLQQWAVWSARTKGEESVTVFLFPDTMGANGHAVSVCLESSITRLSGRGGPFDLSPKPQAQHHGAERAWLMRTTVRRNTCIKTRCDSTETVAPTGFIHTTLPTKAREDAQLPSPKKKEEGKSCQNKWISFPLLWGSGSPQLNQYDAWGRRWSIIYWQVLAGGDHLLKVSNSILKRETENSAYGNSIISSLHWGCHIRRQKSTHFSYSNHGDLD